MGSGGGGGRRGGLMWTFTRGGGGGGEVTKIEKVRTRGEEVHILVILSESNNGMSPMEPPNIFNLVTSDLSQQWFWYANKNWEYEFHKAKASIAPGRKYVSVQRQQ